MLLQNIWFTGIKLVSYTIEDTITLMRHLLLSLCVLLYSYVGGQTPLPLLEEFDNFDGPGEWTSPGGNTGSHNGMLCYNLSGSYLGNVWYAFESPIYDFSSYSQVDLFWRQYINLRPGDQFRLYYYDLMDNSWYYFALEGLGSGFQFATIPNTANQVTFDLITTGSGNRNGKYAHVEFLEMYSPTVLPVELLYFEGDLFDKGANLKWATASENNSSHFLVYRSIDGYDWELINQTPGAGNSTEERTYQIKDLTIVPNSSYYKLVQVDYDGKSEEFGPINLFRAVSGHSSIRLTTDLLGRKAGNDYKGLVIEYYIDGTSRKVMRF